MLSQDERARPAWCGGDTVVVQLGDVLDRGDNEIGELVGERGGMRQEKEEEKERIFFPSRNLGRELATLSCFLFAQPAL